MRKRKRLPGNRIACRDAVWMPALAQHSAALNNRSYHTPDAEWKIREGLEIWKIPFCINRKVDARNVSSPWKPVNQSDGRNSKSIEYLRKPFYKSIKPLKKTAERVTIRRIATTITKVVRIRARRQKCSHNTDGSGIKKSLPLFHQN